MLNDDGDDGDDEDGYMTMITYNDTTIDDADDDINNGDNDDNNNNDSCTPVIRSVAMTNAALIETKSSAVVSILNTSMTDIKSTVSLYTMLGTTWH